MKKLASSGLLIAVLGVLSISFQNCGGLVAKQMDGTYIAASVADDDASFFNYPYAEMPAFYENMTLYALDSDISTLKEFKFMGSAVYANDSLKAVTYQITVTSPTGVLMCPTQKSTLENGATAIEFDCTTSISSKEAVVEMTLTSGSATASYRQAFKAK